jgi:DNA-directed RNA polymerase subunit L
MDIKVLKSETKELVIEFDTSDLTMPDLLAAVLLENDDVEFAGVAKDHPETGKPVLTVKTGEKKAVEVVEKALGQIGERATGIKAGLAKKK